MGEGSVDVPGERENCQSWTISRNRCGLARYACGSVCRQERAAPQSPGAAEWGLPHQGSSSACPVALATICPPATSHLPARPLLPSPCQLRGCAATLCPSGLQIPPKSSSRKTTVGKGRRNLVPSIGRMSVLGIRNLIWGKKIEFVPSGVTAFMLACLRTRDGGIK